MIIIAPKFVATKSREHEHLRSKPFLDQDLIGNQDKLLKHQESFLDVPAHYLVILSEIAIMELNPSCLLNTHNFPKVVAGNFN
jgi:hypothetical protein